MSEPQFANPRDKLRWVMERNRREREGLPPPTVEEVEVDAETKRRRDQEWADRPRRPGRNAVWDPGFFTKSGNWIPGRWFGGDR
nr:hypothetical protein [uncultured Ruegeria sp.]